MIVRPWVDGFNDRRVEVLFPGPVLVPDEAVSAWEGESHAHGATGLPHQTRIARKPKGIGSELKAVADGETGIMLGLEIQEGAARMKNKEFMDDPNMQTSTAWTLRLTKPWNGTGRTIVGDSAFSSFKTVLAVLNVGNNYTGIIKGATTGFPMPHFKEWEATSPQRGEYSVVETTVQVAGQARKVVGIAWKTKMMKLIITTVGNTLPGNPLVSKRSKRILMADGRYGTHRYTKETARPKVISDMFEHFSAVDVHDHYRQGTLRMEITWPTKTWHHRIIATVLGMVMVDAYFAYRFDHRRLNHGDEGAMLPFMSFVDQVAFKLLFNRWLQGGVRPHRDSHAGGGDDEDDHGVEVCALAMCCMYVCLFTVWCN